MDVFIARLVPWLPVFAALGAMIGPLIPALQAEQEHRSPRWALGQYLVIVAVPFYLNFLALLATPFVAIFSLVGFYLAGLLVRRSEQNWAQTLKDFLTPLSRLSVLMLLFGLTVLPTGLMLILYRLTYFPSTPHFQTRTALIIAGLVTPVILVGIIYNVRFLSWPVRAGLSSALSGVACLILVLPAWHGQDRIFLGAPQLESDGSLHQEHFFQPADGLCGVSIWRSKLGSQGLELLEGSPFREMPSAGGGYEIEVSVGSERNADTITPEPLVLKVCEKGGRPLARLGSTISRGIDTAVHWSQVGENLSYQTVGEPLFCWTPDSGVQEVGQAIRGESAWSPVAQSLYYIAENKTGIARLMVYQVEKKQSLPVLEVRCSQADHPGCRMSLGLRTISPDGRWATLVQTHTWPDPAKTAKPATTNNPAEEDEELRPKSLHQRNTLILNLSTHRSVTIPYQAWCLWSPDGKVLAAEPDGRPNSIDPTDGRAAPITLPTSPRFVGKTADRYLLFDNDNCYYSTDCKDWKQIPATGGQVGFSPDGRLVYSIDEDPGESKKERFIRVFNTVDGSEKARYDYPSSLTPGFWQCHPYRLAWRSWMGRRRAFEQE